MTRADDIKTIRDALEAADNRMNEMNRFIPKLAPDFRYLQALAALERLENDGMRLPVLPEGYFISDLQQGAYSKKWLVRICEVDGSDDELEWKGFGLTPRAAMIAAIAQIQGER